MRKQDFIRLQRTRWALSKIESRLLKIGDRLIRSGLRKGDDRVDFDASLDDVLYDITVIQSRVGWARCAVEDLLNKAEFHYN